MTLNDYVLALARRILQFSDRTIFLVALQLLLGNLAPGRQFWFASATADNACRDSILLAPSGFMVQGRQGVLNRHRRKCWDVLRLCDFFCGKNGQMKNGRCWSLQSWDLGRPLSSPLERSKMMHLPRCMSFVMFRIVSSISMICSTAHWLQSSTKWTRLSLQSVSGSILPMVFGQRALDLDNLGHTWTIFDLHVGRICNACSPSFCMFFSTVKLRAFCKKGQGCLVRPDRFVFPFPEKSRFVDSPDMSRYGTIGRYVCFYVIIPAFLRLGAACMRISRCSEWAAVKARPDEVVPRNLLMRMNHMNVNIV